MFATPQTITLNGTELPVVTADMTLQGPAAGVTVSGNQKSRVFEVGDTTHHPTVTISGLTVIQGSANVGGGILANSGVTLMLTNCTLSGNAARDGPGAGGNGGGIRENAGTLLALTSCTLAGNAADNLGGGIDNNEGTLALTNCNFSGNTATFSGGGISNDSFYSAGPTVVPLVGSLTLANCTLAGNIARQGGGLSNDGGNMALTNCTLAGNAAGNQGGGILNSTAYFDGAPEPIVGNVTLTNCTLAGNTAYQGGGLFKAFVPTFVGAGASRATLINTIVAGNQAPAGPDVFTDVVAFFSGGVSFSLIGDGSGSHIGGGTGNQIGTSANPINPLLAPLGACGGPTQTMALLPGSPAIDAGSNAVALDTHGQPLAADQRGSPRIVNGAVDLGAVESQGFTLTVLGGDGQTAAAGTAFPAPFTVRVTANDAAEPVLGGVVTFTAPASGASGTFDSGMASANATIDATGTATAPAFAANGVGGSYAVTTSAAGTAPVAFQLANQTIGPTPPTPPGLSASQRFVFHLYQDLLGRQSTSDEVNFFGALLDQGFLTRAQLAQFFLQSFEYLARQVDQLYVRLLGRHAEPAAQAVGAAFLAAGGRLSQLEAILLGSAEYFRSHGGTSAGFLAGLGQDVAGGALDPGDVSLFTAELATGTTRFVVALEALSKPAAFVAQAQAYDRQLLRRNASASEAAVQAVALLFAGDHNYLEFLLSSAEYFGRG
jgi:hypothetical protein